MVEFGKPHGPKKLDVELDNRGHVVAVWFGCLALPYSECYVNVERQGEMRRMYEEMDVRIKFGEFDPIEILQGRLEGQAYGFPGEVPKPTDYSPPSDDIEPRQA